MVRLAGLLCEREKRGSKSHALVWSSLHVRGLFCLWNAHGLQCSSLSVAWAPAPRILLKFSRQRQPVANIAWRRCLKKVDNINVDDHCPLSPALALFLPARYEPAALLQTSPTTTDCLSSFQIAPACTLAAHCLVGRVSVRQLTNNTPRFP